MKNVNSFSGKQKKGENKMCIFLWASENVGRSSKI